MVVPFITISQRAQGITFVGASTSPDFTITAISPVTFTSGSVANSNVIVNYENGFDSEVVLTTIVSPSIGLSFSMNPSTFVYGGGISNATFSSSTPGDYSVTITAKDGSLSHATTIAVTVTSVGTPDFRISANYSSVNIQAGNSRTAAITVAPKDGFAGTVTLSVAVSPSGPTTNVSSSSITGGAGTSTLTIDVGSSVVTGTYTVTVQATSGNLAHSNSIILTVTDARDVTVTAGVLSLSFNSGASGATTITVTPWNGFTGTITLAITAPTGVSCSISSTNIQSMGTSTLRCNGNTAGNYTVTITATGGASHHTITVNVHVAAVSPVAPAPLTILGPSAAVILSIIGIVIVIFAGSVLAIRRSKRSRS